MNKKIWSFLFISFFGMTLFASAAKKLNAFVIGDFENGCDGWEFTLGTEFKGAEGNFAPDTDYAKIGKKSGWMEGYFGKGGAYVGIRKVFTKPLNVMKVSFWLKAPGLEKITFRITGEDHQTFQKYINIKDTKDWQKITIDNFTKGAGCWGGAKDGKLRLPAKSVMIILDHSYLRQELKEPKRSGQIWIDGITVYTKPCKLGSSIKVPVK